MAAESIRTQHRTLAGDADALECETRLVSTLAQFLKWFGLAGTDEPKLGSERTAVRQACRYIEERFAEGVSLTQLAEHVSLSPYYLLRVFRARVGMPPYAYLESVRIRQAQQLIKAGRPLADIAVEVGFSSQSHLTRRFKQIIGVTPGRYAQQSR